MKDEVEEQRQEVELIKNELELLKQMEPIEVDGKPTLDTDNIFKQIAKMIDIKA